jgi:hypothetical protein
MEKTMRERIPVVFGFKVMNGSLYETIDLATPEDVEGRLAPGQRVVLYQDNHKEVEAEVSRDAQTGKWIFEPDAATERELPYRKTGYGAWRILVNGAPIGEVKAPRTYESMGMTFGPFVPYPSYETVRPVFRRATTNHNTERDYRERGALALSVETLDGRPVPVNWVGITDYSEEMDGEDAYHVEVNVDYRIFQDDQYWSDDAP